MGKKQIEVKKKVEVSIPKINLKRAVFSIKGKTPLLIDKMPEDTLKAIQDKQTGISKSGKKVRDIDSEIEKAIHRISSGEVGFPSGGFKFGMIESTSFVGDKMFSKKLIKGLQIVNSVEGLIPITFKKQDVLIHNIESNTKHTPQFHDWSCKLEIQFDSNNVSEQDIAALINYAGFYYGVGIWSPRCKCGGSYGMYELATK